MLSTTPTFAQRLLIPKLSRFRKLHPAIRLSIDTCPRQMDLPLEGFDLSVQIGRAHWQTGRAELLFSERLLPVTIGKYLSS